MKLLSDMVRQVLVLVTLSYLITSPVSAETGKLLFGLGPEANDAINQPLAQQAPIKMLSSWYNGTKDLQWMQHWKSGTVPASYAKGYAMHLIIFSDDPEKNMQTQYGEACGRNYPLSQQFLEDMKKLADIFKGNGPLYVTVFTEFQTYPCKDNQWKGNENYYTVLKDQYRETRNIFKETNPNAKVSLGWGGWQARYDDKGNLGGRSLFKQFDDIMRISDFQSFQSMQSDHNTEDIRDMTTILAEYGPVMLAHYKPDNRSQETFDRDIKHIFTDNYINEITNKGLFAMSFMDHYNKDKSEQSFELIKKSVIKYANNNTSLPRKTIRPTPTPTITPTIPPSATPRTNPISEFKADNFIDQEKTLFARITAFFQSLLK